MSIGLGSKITPSGSNDSKFSVYGHGSRKPRLLCAREGGRRYNQITYLLYDALWKEEQAWSKISRIVKEHVSNPLVAPGQDQDCDQDPREEAQVIDLTSLLNWTTMDVNLDLLTPIVLVRGEYSKLDNFLETSSEHVVLVGQPSIGWSNYLLFHPVM